MAAPSVDRISLLPDSLLEDILVRLPFQEAVKTSILSKRWIFLWTQLPKLVFDDSFCEELIFNDQKRLMNIILGVLFRVRKPLLDLTFSVDITSGLAYKIDELVNYVANNGIEYFKLDLPNGQYYDLPSLDQLHSVKSLSLEACNFEIPSEFSGFTMLKYVNLFVVNIEGHHLSTLVSSCPMLETIILEKLHTCWDIVVLDAPNLKKISCVGFSLSVSIKYTPRLEEMKFFLKETVYTREEDSDNAENDFPEDIVVPFGVIPAIKYMELDGFFLKYMNKGTHQVISRSRNFLNDLKFIKLHDIPFESLIVSQNVLSLIRCAPNLEKIVVSTSTEHLGSDLGLGVWQAEILADVSYSKLRRVHVLQIDTNQSELFFIKTLLAKSPVLETMVVSIFGEITEEDKQKILEEISLFQRASSQVKIIAMDP